MPSHSKTTKELTSEKVASIEQLSLSPEEISMTAASVIAAHLHALSSEVRKAWQERDKALQEVERLRAKLSTFESL